jgi:hypothetical protein
MTTHTVIIPIPSVQRLLNSYCPRITVERSESTYGRLTLHLGT